MTNPFKPIKRSIGFLGAALAAVVLLAVAQPSSAQTDEESATGPGSDQSAAQFLRFPSRKGTLIVPSSSVQQVLRPGETIRAHTNVIRFRPDGVDPASVTPPFAGYFFETPESFACHYKFNGGGSRPGCNPNDTTLKAPTGGSNRIAIVDAFHDPDAVNDLTAFSSAFSLPAPTPDTFQGFFANAAGSSCSGGNVPQDSTGGWELEESLDIEYAHAMAPNATLYLVEACSNSAVDLAIAIRVASNLVRCGATKFISPGGALGTCGASAKGAGEVSMSFSFQEFIIEKNSDNCAHLNDSCFTAPNVVYVASSGDSSGTEYPSVSPNVVAAGGTTIRRDQASGDVIAEAAWVEGGGGLSLFEARPSYQDSISGIVGAARGVPDLSFDADPNTAAWVYDTFGGTELGGETGWFFVGGTSLSAPALAGVINRAGSFAASSQAELTTLYANKAVTADITDIKTGFCGFYMGLGGVAGWDFCTGVGVPFTYAGK